VRSACRIVTKSASSSSIVTSQASFRIINGAVIRGLISGLCKSRR
jgi:hypothetical protein